MLNYEVMISTLSSSLRLRLWNGAFIVSAYVLCLKKQCAFWNLTCDKVFIFLSSSFSTFFLFIIKSLTSMLSEKKSKKYVIVTHECDKSKFLEWWFFSDLIKAKCVHMHTDNFNLKEFNIASQQSISSHWLETYMAIWHVNGNECLKVTSEVKMLSSLMIMSLQVITNNVLHILKESIKQRDQRLMMIEKSSTVLQCFKSAEINVRAF